MTTQKTPKNCKCHGLPRNAHGACSVKKRKTDRAVQERRLQGAIGEIRYSKVFPTVEEAEQARSRLLNFRTSKVNLQGSGE